MPSDGKQDEKLKLKRSSIKGRLTKFKNYLDTVTTLENICPLEINKLSMKLSRLQALYSDFDEVQGQIEILEESDQAEELNVRDSIEHEFDTCISIAQDFIETNSPVKEQNSPQRPSSAASSYKSQCEHDNCDTLGFRLPVIKIPNFDGSCFKWLEFKETYISLVHENNKIKNIHKFHYLLSYLEGEAARVLCNLEVTGANYSEAWQLLTKRYDNKRQLINNHLKALFGVDSVRETDKSLRFIVDHVTKNLRALCTLGLPTNQWDALIIYMIATKLDNSTCLKWEEHRTNLPEIPSLEQFFDFLKNRANVLETVNRQRHDKSKMLLPTPQPKVQTKAFALTTKSKSPPASVVGCLVCNGPHRLYECATFKAKSPEDRVSFASTLNLCVNCLRVGHNVQTCRLPGSCRSCKQKHNTLLHVPAQHEVPGSGANQFHSLAAMTDSDVLLCTAQVNISNFNTNETLTVRALLDSGSQSTFITEDVQQRLNLTCQPSNVSIAGLSDAPLTIDVKRCALHLQSLNDPFNVNMSCLVIPKIADKIPKATLDVSRYDFSNFKLADPTFYETSSIDMLIGADLFWDLIGSHQHSLGTNNPILQSSKLGWLISGPLPILNTYSPNTKENNKTIKCNFLTKEPNLSTINYALEKFWELENIPQSHPYSQEESLCEQHYLSNTYRLDTGRFCVGLPLREEKDCLGDSYFLAKKRFLSLEARFKRQPELKRLYVDFIHEYAELGHLEEPPIHRPATAYFLPHHPVIRTKSESTQLRVVFDASARSSSGFSVNDLQMVGPVVQDSLFNILLRFRQYKYIISGDVEKMYRQVRIRESDRDMQLILWRDNENEPLRTLRLNTVTYGFASASFLSTRCIWQLGEECKDPSIKTIIQNDFYCDDLLSGAETEESLKYIQRQVSNELSKGCFHLRKYRSNLPTLFDDCSLPEKGNLLISNSTNTLGIGWSPSSDNLLFQIDYSPDSTITKRSILSSTFKIFDPLGLLALCTIKPKILLQELWSLKLDWDDEVPDAIKKSWQGFSLGISSLSSLEIPRRVLLNNSIFIEMHCFCDASEKAFGSCIYLRSKDTEGNVETNLLCAKSRVAPLKATTIPRLELCAALLGAQLTTAATQALRLHINRHIYWSDSKVVLGWLQSANKTKTFVANRVAAIHELSDPSHWRYVPTGENPADLCSRGIEPQQVAHADLWWHGPLFLMQSEAYWPTFPHSTVVELPELKAFPALVAEPAPSVAFIDVTKFSKLNRLQRVSARALRFIYNCRNPNNKLIGILTVDELQGALSFLIKTAQLESFPNEIACLESKRPLPTKSNLLSLNAFIDECQLLRVGGRIDKSNHPYNKRHPILLDSKHHLTKLLFRFEHERLMHAPPQLLLTSIRDQYWPLGGRKLARLIYNHCVRCRRYNAKSMTNIMGNLPVERVEPDFPFKAVATDFAGPFLITDRKGRGCKITKCYLCIFVCLRYKCLHLEPVSELSRDAFILTLKRFIARRGLPNLIYCDNATNYVAAAKEIKAFFEFNNEYFSDFAAQRGIEFRFSPVYAPSFNGLAESSIKSAKLHLRRILGQTHLTFEELASLFAQIEAILNSRPLCPLSPSPNDFQPLTPAHFLIGRPLTSLPSPSFGDSNSSRLNRFQRLEELRNHFWRRWSNEFIAELQQRRKWRVKCRDLRIDDLVLIKDETPPLYWRLGRVSKLFPGSDGIPRVADVKTARGTIRRALNRLCLLPTDCSS
ncbi:uncharacterized protein [Choristoneura fumiferana]|uniref:uncharacterized protein n=1 Tax=Choristoneura fumiferana TaxID=7141 RepID=UPI003D153E5C